MSLANLKLLCTMEMLTCQPTCCKHASPRNSCFPHNPFSKKMLVYAPGIQRWTSSQRWISEVNWELCEYVKGWSAWVGPSKRQQRRKTEWRCLEIFHHHNQLACCRDRLCSFFLGSIFSFESFVKLMKKCQLDPIWLRSPNQQIPGAVKGKCQACPPKETQG